MSFCRSLFVSLGRGTGTLQVELGAVAGKDLGLRHGPIPLLEERVPLDRVEETLAAVRSALSQTGISALAQANSLQQEVTKLLQ